jgi:hypothetical protein
MRLPVFRLALMVMLLATPVHRAQPPATTDGAEILMQVTIDELRPDLVATAGIVRTIYPAGATLQLTSGSGPSLHFVEAGALTVSTGSGSPALTVRAGTTKEYAAPATVTPGDEVVVPAGDAFLLAPASTVEMHNGGTDPTAVLGLLAAPDVVKVGDSVTQDILVRQDVTLPEPPVSVTLSRVTLEPGARLAIPVAPAVTFYTAVERSQAFNLSGQGINRLAVPLDAYIVVFDPDPPRGCYALCG